MTDVVVVGGGTAGVFAAISAARTGAKTILIEKNSMLGGTITAAAVNFPGLFFAWGNQIIDGPCWEAIERTIELGGARMPKISYQPGNHWEEQILLNRFVYTYVLNEMCREGGGCITPRRCIWALSKCYGRPGDALVKYTEDRHAYRYEERRYFGRKNGTFYEDSVCYGFYPIDLHVKNGIEQKYLHEGVVPKIPYRALIPKHAKRVLCAGRIVSSDQYANSAVRVQACCMAIGQVAGCAAAICAMSDQHVANVEYPELCDKLKQIGCIVPAR